MRGSDRVGNVNQQLQSERNRHRLQSTPHFRPLPQVPARILALQKKRRTIEVPLVDSDELRPLSQGLPQKPRNRDLALQPLKPDAIRSKLEYSLFPGFGILRNPYFAR